MEIEDAYAGPEPACGELVEAQLGFRLRNDTPLPVRLQDGVPVELSLAPLQTKWFEVNSFVWTERIASCIVTSDTPVSLLFSDVLPEPGAPPPTTLLADSQNGCFELSNVSSPPVAPGAKFYLALQNAGSSFVQASIQVNETPVVRTLITRTPQFESSLQPGAADYYTFNVLESAERLQFRLSGLSDNADLFVRKGLPLPDATNALASGQSPGTAEEWIVLRPTESMALSGTWFAAVVNMGEAPVGYTIEAIQSIESGTPITASTAVAGGNQVCVRWTSVPGAGYHVLGCTNLPAAEWSVVSDRIIADDIETTHCLPVTQTQEYFRISEVVGYD